MEEVGNTPNMNSRKEDVSLVDVIIGNDRIESNGQGMNR